MAPRKKRAKPRVKVTRKTRSTKKDSVEAESVAEADIEDVLGEKQAPTRTLSTHKKFGKFRCLLETTSNSDTGLETEEEQSLETPIVEPQDCDNSVSMDLQEVPKEDDPGQGVELEVNTEIVAAEVEAKASVDLEAIPSEVVLQPSEMECAEVVDAEEVTDQLSNLNVNAEDESNKLEPELNVEPSEFAVECVSEEIIPVLEIEIGETTDIDATVETVEPPVITEEQPVVEKPIKPKTPKKPKPKTSPRKKSLPTPKSNKKEPKTKTKTKKSPNSPTTEALENSVRRSSRIKSISVLKLRSKGQGLVKPKTDEAKKNLINDSDTSENSNSGHTDSEKASTDSPNFLTPSSGYDSDHKPVKVKSRWRRSSELEMGSVTVNTKSSESPIVPPIEEKIENDAARDEEIRSRLKQFIHLKENNYLTSRVSCKEAKKMICDCFLTSEEVDRGELACGEDCLNRLLMIECGAFCPVNERCTNKRFQKSQFSPCEVFHTDKKGLGIRATGDIPFGEFILEYIGEVIGPDEFEDRATEYSKGKNPHYYFMSLRSDAVIDATQKGNISRFINHSCEPNAETQKWTVNGELRIGFFSKRTILAGEEITFDYQFQRYGKEAQKCFCEAPTCRGWLGEEPDEDDEEEEEEDEEEEEEEEVVVEQKIIVQPEVIQQPVPETVEEVKEISLPPVEPEITPEQPQVDITLTPPVIPPDITIIPPPPPPPPPEAEIIIIKKTPKKEKRKIIKRKALKDIFDDVDVDEEIEMLIATGLKNQAHTLKLSRLMVRANEATQRTALLRILRHGEFPCRRLFLDYHGLRLIHGWMNDAQQLCKTDTKQESLRLELLQTLATLPIPNKTMLQDSKVLSTVEKWSVKLEDVSTGMDSESNSPKLESDPIAPVEADNTEVVETQKETVKLEVKVENKVIEEVEEAPVEQNGADIEYSSEEGPIEEIRRSVGMDIEEIRSKNHTYVEPSSKKLVQDIIDMFDDDMDISPIAFNEDDNIIEVKEVIKPEKPKQDYEVEIIALALKLLEEWSVLKEVFRIPKKERIEQMKEHEREANRGYKAGLEHDSERRSRYRGLSRHRSGDKTDFLRKGLKDDRSSNPFPKINKHERRKLFAMQVEQEEVEKRLKHRDNIWRQHEFQYMTMGPPDPRFTAPFDPSRNFQCLWNQQTGQWQNYSMPMNPILNPRFNTAMHYGYNTGNGVPQMPPLPNMPMPPSNMGMPPSNMGMPPSTMGMPPSTMGMPPSTMGMPPSTMGMPPSTMGMTPSTMGMPPSTMAMLPTNMMPPTNMSMPPSSMALTTSSMSHPHPPNYSQTVTNMPPPGPNVLTMPPHPGLNISNPPPTFQVHTLTIAHPPPNMNHPPPNLVMPNIPTNIPPPLPNIPPLPNVTQMPNNTIITNVPPPLPNNPINTMPPMPGNPINTMPPMPGNPINTMPPMPGNPINTMPPMPGNPVHNMPPLPNVPPPLPNMPPPMNNMQQQVANMTYQEEKTNEKEDLTQVKFAGPIPLPVKLPPKWKCAKDKYGRPYYYHIKLRIPQWEPPEFPPPVVEVEEESSDSTSSSETSSLSSDSSSEDSDDDDPDDTKLLLEIRRKFQQMDSLPKSSPNTTLEQETKDLSPDDSVALKNQELLEETLNETLDDSKASSLDERLKEEFNLAKRESSQNKEPPVKKKRLGLVTQVHIISPRSEEDKINAKENLRKYKENKERLKRLKEAANNTERTTESKKRVKVTVKNPRPSKKHKTTVKTKLKEAMDLNSEAVKKIKEAFRSTMAGVMVGILNPYRKPDCKEGRITNTEDFKHLARKLTHFVMLKELKHCQNIEDLTCTDSVKSKAKEFVRKYMSKFGEIYTRPNDDLDY